MSAGISTSNLPSASSIFEVLGNAEIGGARRTVRVPVGVLLNALTASSIAVWAATRSQLDDLLGYPANTGGMVVADPTAANNGIYIKSGASGSGSWAKARDLLTGPAGASAEFRFSGDFLQWRLAGSATWTNLVSVSALTGPAVEMQALAGQIQYRPVGGSTWTNLLAVDGLKGAQGAAGRDGGLYPYARPGDGTQYFTLVPSLAALGGEPDALAPLDGSKVGFGTGGGVARIVGLGILAAREAEPIEPGRIREVRAVLRRQANASDPSNDTVRVGLLWLDQAKSPLPGPAFSVIADLNALLTASGRQEVKAYVAAAAGDGVTIVAPAGAAYFRRFVYNFGLDGATDIETLASTDVTGQAIPPAVTTDFQNRLAAQESLNVGARLNAVESAVQNPNSLTYATRTDAAAATVPATVTTIVTRGLAAAGDGKGSTYRRGNLGEFNAAPAGTAFQSANGGYFLRVDKGVRSYDLGDDALAMSARRLIYRRKVRSEVPYTPASVATFLTNTYGVGTAPGQVAAPYTYPVGMAMNSATNELFVAGIYTLRGANTPSDDAGLGIYYCYDISGGLANPVLKWWFRTTQYPREGIVYKAIAGRKYLYAIGDIYVCRWDVTEAFTNGAEKPPETIYSDKTRGYFEIAAKGDGFVYMSGDPQNPGGLQNKTNFIITDRDINPRGRFAFPLMAMGTYVTSSTLRNGKLADYQNYFPKVQGLSCLQNVYVLFVGGIYNSAGGSSESANADLMSKQHGVILCNERGDVLESGLCRPDAAMAITAAQVGRALTVHENEGGTTDPATGKVYSIWNTVATAERGTVGATRGVVIYEEFCPDADAPDFSISPSALRVPLDTRSGTLTATYGGGITNPVTGETMTSLDHIIDMMMGCQLKRYEFWGFNNTITDITGTNLPLNNGKVVCEVIANTRCQVTIFYQQGGSLSFGVGNLGGLGGSARGQGVPLVWHDATGMQYGGDASSAGTPTELSANGYTLNPLGTVSAYRASATPLNIGRGSDGYGLAVYRGGVSIGGLRVAASTLRYFLTDTVFIAPVSGNPEGNLAAPVGSMTLNTNTGAMHVKTSGTGNTGWTAK